MSRHIVPMELSNDVPAVSLEQEEIKAEIVALVPAAIVDIENILMSVEVQEISMLVQLSYRENESTNDSAVAGIAIAGLAVAGNF